MRCFWIRSTMHYAMLAWAILRHMESSYIISISALVIASKACPPLIAGNCEMLALLACSMPPCGYSLISAILYFEPSFSSLERMSMLEPCWNAHIYSLPTIPISTRCFWKWRQTYAMTQDVMMILTEAKRQSMAVSMRGSLAPTVRDKKLVSTRT